MREFVIFTDGACRGNPGPGGYGAIVWNKSLGSIKEIGAGSPHTTNNAMELEAIYQSIKAVLEQLEQEPQETKNTLRLFSDSTYALKGIEAWRFGWRKKGWRNSSGDPVANLELWQSLDRLLLDKVDQNPRVSLELHHVFGHQGIPGNERVDTIATSYAASDPVDLFEGTEASYGIDLTVTQAASSNSKSTKQAKPSSKSSKKPYGYISYVGGEFQVHRDWESCRLKVHGQTQAKYRKVFSEQEIDSYRREWGAAKA